MPENIKHPKPYRGDRDKVYVTGSDRGTELIEGPELIDRARGSEKTCPCTHKPYKNYREEATKPDQTDYYCPECNSLVAKDIRDFGRRVVEVYDWDHVPER